MSNDHEDAGADPPKEGEAAAGAAPVETEPDELDVDIDVDISIDMNDEPTPIAKPIDEQGPDEIEALDDDDLEILDDDDLVAVDEVEERRVVAAPPPPVPRPPPMPKQPPAPSPQTVAASVESTSSSEQETEEPPSDEINVADGAPAVRPGTAPPVPGLEIPTALDKLLERGPIAPQALLETLTETLQTSTDPVEQARLGHEIGEISLRHARDQERARKAHERALEADPSFRANTWALRRLLHRTKEWARAAELIDTELPFARDDVERANLLLEKAFLLEHRLDRADDAKAALEEAILLDPACLRALLALERFAVRDGDPDFTGRILRALADASKSPQRKAQFLMELAELIAQGGELHAPDSLAALEEAAKLDVEQERIGRLQERIAEASEDWKAAIAGLERQIDSWLAKFGPAGPPQPEPRDLSERPNAPELARSTIVALRRRQARLARQHLLDDQRAWDYLQQALVLLPAEPLLLADLADLAERLGKYEELAELCAGWESQEADPLRSLSLSLRRAEALMHGGHSDEASRLLASLAATAPGYLPVTALLERDAIARLDWRGLALAYGQMGHAAALGGSFAPGVGTDIDENGAAGLYTIAGDLLASPAVEDVQEARQYYGRALELVPGHAGAVEALVSLYERHGLYEDACQLLELQSEIEEAPRRLDYLQRLGRLYQELGQFKELASVLRRLIELSPEDVALRFRLEELLADLGLTEERAEVLFALSEAEHDPSRKAAALIEAARIREFELEDDEGARDIYKSVLELDPDDAFAREAVQAIARRKRNWQELVELRKAEAANLSDGPRLVRALREAADITLHELHDPTSAIGLYRKLCDRMPGDEVALYGLAGALEEANDSNGLASVREQIAELYEPGAPRATALLLLAEAYATSGLDTQASDTYQRVAEAAPESPHGAVAEAEYAQVSGDVAQFTDALVQMRSRRADPEVRGQMSEYAGWLSLLRLGDFDRAASEFDAAVQANPSRPGPRLGTVLSQARIGDAHKQADALANLAANLGGGYASSSAYLHSAMISQVDGDAHLASRRIGAAAAVAPDDAGVLVAVSEQAPEIQDLEPSLASEALGSWGETLATRAALAQSDAARDSWELDAAEAFERAGRLGEALELIVGVLNVRPDDLRALSALRKLCTRGGDRAGLARVLVTLGRILGDGHAKMDLWRQAAAIFDTELGDTSSAVAVYRRILAVDPEAGEWDRLHAILAEADDISGLYDLLTSKLNRLEDRGERGPGLVELLRERSNLRERVADTKGASRDLSRLLKMSPHDKQALGRQADLLVRLGEVQAAATALERYLEVEEDQQLRARAEIQLSELLAESLDDYTGAIVQLEHALRSGPEDDRLRDRLISYLLQAEKWNEAVAELEKIAAARTRPKERARDYLRLADIHLSHRSDPGAAHTALEKARQCDPLNLDAVRALAELVGDHGDVQMRNRVLASAARDLRAALSEHPRRASLYERLAVVNRWLGETEGRFFALSAYGALRSLGAEERRFIAESRAAVAPLPTPLRGVLETKDWRDKLSHPGFSGVATDIWSTLAGAVDELRGRSPEAFGFGRAHRVAQRSLAKSHPRVSAVVEAFGVGSAEVFVDDSRTGIARVTGQSKPRLLLSGDVARAEGPETRFLLGRAVAQAKDRSAALSELSDEELRMIFAAASRIAGLTRLPTELSELAQVSREGGTVLERQVRQLQKHVGRGERKNLAVTASSLSELGDPAQWRTAGVVTAARAGLLVCGDLFAALDILDLGKGGRTLVDEPGALDILSWAASTDHLLLRAKLGLRPVAGAEA